jgi:hypothetical protein
MRHRTHADRQRPLRQGGEANSRTDTVVATVWLAFYVLAIVVAISSPAITRAIDLAAR